MICTSDELRVILSDTLGKELKLKQETHGICQKNILTKREGGSF